MTIGDRLNQGVDKAGGAEKVKEQVGRAADRADSATGGRYQQAVGKGEQAAKSAVDRFTKKDKSKNKNKRRGS